MEFLEDTLLAMALIAGVGITWWLVAYRRKLKK